MDALVKFLSNSSGKEKIFRFIQYFSRLFWTQLDKFQYPQVIDSFKTLETNVAIARRLYRFGSGFEVLMSSFNSFHINDPIDRLTISLSKISLSIHLFLDHLIWLSSSGFMINNHSNSNLVKNSNRFWLFSILLILCRNVYNFLKEFQTKAMTKFSNQIDRFNNFVKAHKPILLDFVKNFCDLWIPLNSLGFIKLSPGTVGFLGTLSSLLAILQMLDPTCRL